MNKKGIIYIVGSFLVFSTLAVFLYFSNLNKKNFPQPPFSEITVAEQENTETEHTATDEPDLTGQPQPTDVEEIETESDIPEGWTTYTNEDYSFQISYPSTYQALNDEENLYGWPNAVVLLYKGGQSYDLPIEVWNSSSEYEAKYPESMSDLLTVHEVGDFYITLFNQNQSSEVDQIIATFTPLE